MVWSEQIVTVDIGVINIMLLAWLEFRCYSRAGRVQTNDARPRDTDDGCLYQLLITLPSNGHRHGRRALLSCYFHRLPPFLPKKIEEWCRVGSETTNTSASPPCHKSIILLSRRRTWPPYNAVTAERIPDSAPDLWLACIPEETAASKTTLFGSWKPFYL